MYKRQHPITILLGIRISGLFPFILLVIFRSDENEPWYLFYFVLLFLLFVMAIFSAVKWYFKVYWIENNILHIKHGVFVKKESYLNKERVQNVSTSSNIIYQILGLTKLNIEVAGGGSEPEVMLAGIKEDEAKELIALLHKERSVVAEEVPAEEGSKTVYQLKAKEILFASITSGRFGLVFSMLVILYTEFNQFLPEWLINKVEAYVMDNGVYELIVMAAILMAISWVISTAGYALKYANFKIERNGNEIRIVQGLFDKKEFVLKLHRIQAITVKEGILRQPFGYCSVEVEVIQSIESAGNEVMLHPFMKKKDLQQLLAYLQLPYEMEEEIVHLPKAALRCYIIMGWITTAVLAVPIVSASIYFKQYIALFTLIPLCIGFTILAYARYTNGGYMMRENQLTMVYRGLVKYTGIMRRRHIQAVGYNQSYFQKKDELCTAAVSVAGHRYKVKHMRKEDTLRIYNWYKEKGNTGV
ncbi:PH domain-containing protein [Bacillus toyonensis]|uniref:PH domain-containing protein n=1 Tax=Bacillus toyonensis TaxID=155322 RepID=UPI0018A1516C|nr:PH domain-containing protein [Bacillus toyonensis]MBF7145383.1 PH domain-containing protein [Bacillus toyonensis]MEC2347766.1 PH domain-containing protein [Bacillus toyonensis]MED3184858.1 PH domain-containing protein [Bacillus toyonensis]